MAHSSRFCLSGEHSSLYEGKLVTDKTYGHATYGCMTCCGYRAALLEPDPVVVLIDGDDDIWVEALENCGGLELNVDAYAATWTSQDPSIISMQPELAQGVSVGSTTLDIVLDNIIYGPVRDGQTCPLMNITVPGPGSVVPTFNLAYSAYIPVDHVQSTGLGCSYNGNFVSYIYMGDANRGTYRTTEFIQITPDTQEATGFSPGTGQTRQYGYGSPANGQTLSSLDEDKVPNDCYLWNAAATASASNFTHQETYSTSQGQELFTGSASNPLAPPGFAINWNMRTVLDTTNPNAPTAYVNYNHTCYPAHQVVVNGKTIYSYTPADNTFSYITTCLSGISSTKITGQTSPVSVPTH